MNSRLEVLKRTIMVCERIEEIFARQGVRGVEPEHYEDMLAGFEVRRGGLFFGWHLASHGPENDYGKEPAYLDVELSGDQDDDYLIGVFYLPVENIWVVKGSTRIGLDGTATTRSLAADCRLSAGERRQIGEDEAMKIIDTLAAFYAKLPAA